MTKYTFAAGNVASGSLAMEIVNYDSEETDENLEFLLIDFEVDRNIEDNANVLQMTKANFKAWNTNGEFSTKALYSTGIINTRVKVTLTHDEITETAFYGNIDPFSIRYSNQGRIVEFTAYSLLDELGNIPVDYVGEYLEGTLIIGRTQTSYTSGTSVIIYNPSLETKWFIPVGEVIRFGAGATEHTVTSIDGRELTISPALTVNVDGDTEIYPKDRVFTISSVSYITLGNLMRAFYVLAGANDYGMNIDRLRFWRGVPNEEEDNYHTSPNELAIIFSNATGGTFFDNIKTATLGEIRDVGDESTLVTYSGEGRELKIDDIIKIGGKEDVYTVINTFEGGITIDPPFRYGYALGSTIKLVYPLSGFRDRYGDKEEALGILKGLCHSFALVVDQHDDYDGPTLTLSHRNASSTPMITVSDLIESESAVDWRNIFNEFQVEYPQNNTDSPSAGTPLHRTLKRKFSTYNLFAIETSPLRLFIYYGSAIYEVHHVTYLNSAGSWVNGEQRGQSPPERNRACRFLYQDLYKYEKETKSEKYKSVIAYLNGVGTPTIAYLQLCNHMVSNNRFGVSKKYHLKRLTSNYIKNETYLKRVEE